MITKLKKGRGCIIKCDGIGAHASEHETCHTGGATKAVAREHAKSFGFRVGEARGMQWRVFFRFHGELAKLNRREFEEYKHPDLKEDRLAREKLRADRKARIEENKAKRAAKKKATLEQKAERAAARVARAMNKASSKRATKREIASMAMQAGLNAKELTQTMQQAGL